GAGATVAFSVLAGGGQLSFQWRFNGTNLTGSTNSVLLLTNVQSADAGQYDIIITNGFGMTLSDPAWLVMAPPLISLQPQSQTNFTGTSVTFTLTVTGDAPLSFQWLKDGRRLPATNSSVTLVNLQTSDAGQYRAIVSNPLGSATSAVAVLTVLVPL